MRGTFRQGAAIIDRARVGIQRGAETLDETARQRRALADEFESAVMSMSEHVAAAATELSASAGSLADSTHTTVVAADRSADVIRQLSESSAQIEQIVRLINSVAAQTRPCRPPSGGSSPCCASRLRRPGPHRRAGFA